MVRSFPTAQSIPNPWMLRAYLLSGRSAPLPVFVWLRTGVLCDLTSVRGERPHVLDLDAIMPFLVILASTPAAATDNAARGTHRVSWRRRRSACQFARAMAQTMRSHCGLECSWCVGVYIVEHGGHPVPADVPICSWCYSFTAIV